MAVFNKRTFTPGSLLRSSADILFHLGDLRAASRSGRIDRAFRERIMLAVTQVNQCRYCSFYHSRLALRAGVSREEVEELLRGLPGISPPGQAVALAFAQHYAEKAGRPDPQAWDTLVESYGLETARGILAYIRLISFGNLAGNTFDRLLFLLSGGRKG